MANEDILTTWTNHLSDEQRERPRLLRAAKCTVEAMVRTIRSIRMAPLTLPVLLHAPAYKHRNLRCCEPSTQKPLPNEFELGLELCCRRFQRVTSEPPRVTWNMSISPEVLTAQLQQFIQAHGIQPDPSFIEWNSGVYCLLDCVFSAQAKYASMVLPILQRRLPNRGLPDSPELTFSAFHQHVDTIGSGADCFERYAREVLENRQRLGGRLKAEVAYDASRFFAARGIETKAELQALTEQQIEQLVLTDLVREVRGIGPTLARYFLLLAGREEHIKPDTLLMRLTGRVTGWTPRYGHAADTELLRTALTTLARDMNTTPARLDNALWQFESTRKAANPSERAL